VEKKELFPGFQTPGLSLPRGKTSTAQNDPMVHHMQALPSATRTQVPYLMVELRASCAVAGIGLPLSPTFGYKHPTIMTAPYTISSDHLGNFAVCDAFTHISSTPVCEVSQRVAPESSSKTIRSFAMKL
jgi:hypothetical protein